MEGKRIDNSVVYDAFKDFNLDLGLRDLSDKLEIFEESIGREVEYSRLVEAHSRVRSGHQSKELCIVTGGYGIGKSSLIHKFHQHILDEGGYFGTLMF